MKVKDRTRKRITILNASIIYTTGKLTDVANRDFTTVGLLTKIKDEIE